MVYTPGEPLPPGYAPIEHRFKEESEVLRTTQPWEDKEGNLWISKTYKNGTTVHEPVEVPTLGVSTGPAPIPEPPVSSEPVPIPEPSITGKPVPMPEPPTGLEARKRQLKGKKPKATLPLHRDTADPKTGVTWRQEYEDDGTTPKGKPYMVRVPAPERAPGEGVLSSADIKPLRDELLRLYLSDENVWADEQAREDALATATDDKLENVYYKLNPAQRKTFDQVLAKAQPYVKKKGVVEALYQALRDLQKERPSAFKAGKVLSEKIPEKKSEDSAYQKSLSDAAEAIAIAKSRGKDITKEVSERFKQRWGKDLPAEALNPKTIIRYDAQGNRIK